MFVLEKTATDDTRPPHKPNTLDLVRLDFSAITRTRVAPTLSALIPQRSFPLQLPLAPVCCRASRLVIPHARVMLWCTRIKK